MNKKLLAISVSVLTAMIVSVMSAAIIMNNGESEKDSNPSQETNQSIDEKEMLMDKIYIYIGKEKLEVELNNNSTASALVAMLPLELSMGDLNNNEKYAYLGESLPTNTYSPKRIEAGDVMLFGDNCLVIFYKSFDTNYNYSSIGHIDNLPDLGGGDVSVVISTK